MSAKVRKCCIKNCKDTASKRHRFPFFNPDLFNKWIIAIDHPRFASLTPKQIYRSYFVCGIHFKEQHILPAAKFGLSFDAVPTLHMHGAETTVSDSYIYVSAKVALADHNYALSHNEIFNDCDNKSESSKLTCRMCLVNIREEVEEISSINEDFVFHCKLLDFLPEIDLNLTENPVACTQCTIMIAQIHQFKQLCMRTENILKSRCPQSSLSDTIPYIKEEFFIEDMNEEFFDDAIKTEDGYILMNTNIPTCIDEPISENVFYRCHQCNYITNDKNYLTVHVFSHRLKCDECNYTTLDNYSLKIHKDTHLRIWRCNICSYTCEEIHVLNEHMCTHTGADLIPDRSNHQELSHASKSYDVDSSDEEIDVVSVDQSCQNNFALLPTTNNEESKVDKGTTKCHYKLNQSSYDKRQDDSSDNESEIEQRERSLRNDVERQRRNELRDSFEELRLLVPEVSGRDKRRAAKVDILKEAMFYCYELADSSASMQRTVQLLRNKQDFLKARVLKLQKELAARY